MGHGNGWPSPYTYDAEVHDQGRLRAQRDGGRRRLQQQVLRRAVHGPRSTSRRARSSSSTTCATRRATPSRATPSRRVTVARQRADNYAAGFLKAGASAVIADGHAERRGLPPADCSRPTSRSRTCGGPMPNANGHVVSLPVRPDARRDASTRIPNTPDHRLLPLARGRDRRRHDRRGRVRRLRRHGRRPGQPRRPRQRRRRRPMAPRCSAASTPPAEPDHDAAGRDAPPRRRAADPDRPPRAARWSRSQGIDDPSITGYMLASDLAAKRQHGPGRPRPRPGRPRSRPTATRQHDSASIRGRFTESVAWTLRIRNGAGTTLSTRRPGPARRFTVAWDGKVGGDPVAGRHLRGERDRRRRLGQRRRHARPASWSSTPQAPDLDGLTPGAEREPVVLAQRRRRPRHGQPDRHEPRDRARS